MCVCLVTKEGTINTFNISAFEFLIWCWVSLPAILSKSQKTYFFLKTYILMFHENIDFLLSNENGLLVFNLEIICPKCSIFPQRGNNKNWIIFIIFNSTTITLMSDLCHSVLNPWIEQCIKETETLALLSSSSNSVIFIQWCEAFRMVYWKTASKSDLGYLLYKIF